MGIGYTRGTMKIKVYGHSDGSCNCMIDGMSLMITEMIMDLDHIRLAQVDGNSYRAYDTRGHYGTTYITIDKREYDKLVRKVMIEPTPEDIPESAPVGKSENPVDDLEI